MNYFDRVRENPFSAAREPRSRWLAPAVAGAIVIVFAGAIAVQMLAPRPYAELLFTTGLGVCLGWGATIMSYLGRAGQFGVAGLAGAIGAAVTALGPDSTIAAWVVGGFLLIFAAVNLGREVAAEHSASARRPRWLAPAVAGAIVIVFAGAIAVQMLAPKPYAELLFTAGLGVCLGWGATIMSYLGRAGQFGAAGLGGAIGAAVIALGPDSTITAWVVGGFLLIFAAVNLGREVAAQQ